jgi:multimeric flavodoxin WrbA
MHSKEQITLQLPEKVKILGISGSPRKEGNTATMVRYCLEQAETLGYVETEYLSLADCKLYPCTGCTKCFGPDAPDAPYQCYEHPDDDIKTIIPKMVACDGLLLGFPVYVAGVPSLFRMFHEKCAVFGPMAYSPYSCAMRYKALGVISQGRMLYGGQEINHFRIAELAVQWGALPSASWPTRDAPMPQSSWIGGMLTTIDSRDIRDKKAWSEAETVTVPPIQGIRNERTLKNLGRWLAVNAMVVKLGRTAFKQAGYAEPEIIGSPQYKGKPKKGTYLERMVKEGKVTCV